MTALPEKIAALVAGKNGAADTVGLSGAGVTLYPDMALKISPDDDNARREAELMAWLHGKLPVPEVLACERAGGRQFLLMTRLPGVMLCHESVLRDPVNTARLLAEAIEAVRSVETAGCPCRADLDTELAVARAHVERGEVDMENTEPATFGPGGFKDPAHLLDWLEKNRPEEEICFTHGDMCLPNVFAENGRVSGLLDLGGAGLGDPCRDYSIARRSLHHNTDGCHGHTAPGFDADILFRYLGLSPDPDKLRWYELLDELF